MDGSIQPPRDALVARRGLQVRGAAVCLCAAGLLASSACSRAPLELPCPGLQMGELVITELRGAQEGADTYGEWIEVYNPGPEAVSLAGLAVTSIELDGSGEERFLVRASSLSLAPGAYATLGSSERSPLPSHVDYSFALDGVSGLKTRGVLSLESCGAFVDEVVYRDLPTLGSWSLDPSQTPSAQTNDDESAWCVDATPQDPMGPMVELGVPGTPREENHPCTN